MAYIVLLSDVEHKMILVFVLPIFCLISIESKIDEIAQKDSNSFLQAKGTVRNRYEQSREIIETTRESCLVEYRQKKSYLRRQGLSPFCKQYCSETDDCQQENEESACTNPLYPPMPSRTLKFVQKYQRTCYIRITEVLRYDRAEELCQQYGLQLAIIDNMQLLEQLKQMNMFNSTCKGQCPQARGYYIGLKRYADENNPLSIKWIWSNNETWTQNAIDCGDDYFHTSFANASLLCYIGSDGEKKVTVWNLGEPNKASSLDNGEQCVEIIARPDRTGSYEQIGRLNDIPCNKPTLGVLCQIDDVKPVNSTRFKYFATIIGFNETKEDDLINNLLANFDGNIQPNLNAMAAMAAALEGLLALPSFTSVQAATVLNVVDQLVNVTGEVEIEEDDDDDSLKAVTNKLLHFMDLFPAKIQIDNEHGSSFKYANMNTSLVNVDFNEWNDVDKEHQWFTITSDNSDIYPKSIIELNMRVLRAELGIDNNYRIIETIFANFNLFPQINKTNQTDEENDGSNNNQLLGIPISYLIANRTMIKANEDIIKFQIKVPEVIQSTNLSCAYWSFEENNGSWIIDSGCRFMGYINNYAQCYCNHLTHFALMMLPETERILDSLTTVEEFVLTFITYIGIALSIFGLSITLLTYALFRSSQKNRLHTSLFMLCLSILFVNCLYIPFSLTKPQLHQKGYFNHCNIIGFLFHYFFLTSLMWMFIMASIQYMHFVRIFNTHISKFFLKTTIIGWIFPLIFPLIVLFFGKNGGYIGEHRCWINNDTLLYITFLTPISTILLCNVTLFIFTLKSIFQHDSINISSQNNRSKLQISAAICCFVSIGCTWLFGILVLIQPTFVHQLIFTIFNSLQGFLIFLFHIYLSKPKRELWQTFFIQRGFHQRPQSSSLSGPTNPVPTTTTTTGNNPNLPPNLSNLTRPVTFRFTSRSSSSDAQNTTAAINPAFSDQLDNNNQIEINRHSHLNIRSQPDFVYDRIQKARIERDKAYA